MFDQLHTCGECNQENRFPFFEVGRYQGRNGAEKLDAETGFDGTTYDGMEIKGFGLAHCPSCGTPTFFLFTAQYGHFKTIKKNLKSADLILGQNHLLKSVVAFPKPREIEQDPNWPDVLRQHFTDAQKMLFERKTPAIILSVCRTVLEMALKELKTDPGANLFKRIDRLYSDGIITTPIKDWAHAIRLDGNNAVHDGIGNQSDAEEYVEFLKLFLNMTFSLPLRIHAKRSSPQGQQSKSP